MFYVSMNDRRRDANVTTHSLKNIPTLMDGPFHVWVCSDVPPSVSRALVPAV